jgi:4-amino-4-deoxy-L-arabinose transferase-like glycosyltransferase
MPKQKKKKEKTTIIRLGKAPHLSSSQPDKPASSLSRKIRKNCPIIIITLIAAVLFISNLGNHYLWDDEAQTALIGKTILSYGLPLGHDGINSFSQEEGAEFGKNLIWKWHTWLQFYLPALFFMIFGVSTFTARLPFALIAIATIPLIYFFSRFLWKSEKAGLLAAILLTINVPFILLGRQCRYYSLASFFSVLTLFGYIKILEDKKYSRILFIAASTLLFHSFYIYFATMLAAIIAHCLFFHRNKFSTVLKSSLIAVIINAPWIIWLSGINYNNQYPDAFSHSLKLIISFITSYTMDIFTYIIPISFILIPFVVWSIASIRKRRFIIAEANIWRKTAVLILFPVMTVGALSLTSPAAFFRYMAPLIPVLCVLMAMILESSMKINKLIGIAIIGIMLYMSPMHDYLYEITHDYKGPIKGIANYLNQNGNKKDVVLITYGDLPLKFYTDMRIVGGITGEDLTPAKDADWVIIRKHLVSPMAARVDRYISENILPDKYEPIKLNYPDLPWENREEPAEHHYRTVENEDQVVIFRKIK